MPDQHPSLPGIDAASVEATDIPQAEPEAAPVNRAQRRGKAKKHDSTEQRYLGSGGHARPAQGRRINPVRRSG